ncbi:hypothetical protein ACIQUB_06315 [Rhizobium sp. NPDC090275]|uniref:hypothetical protein n=1 Tax=Rhizobium sp. NPDC090275 TaxID=3364498 RepID=UPI00383B7D68
MASKTLMGVTLAMGLVGCQTASDDAKAQIRLNAAAVAVGQTKAQPPKLVLPGSCTAKVDRVVDADEPWVIHNWRWQVSADDRDRKAVDCGAWAEDYNRRLAELQQHGGSN